MKIELVTINTVKGIVKKEIEKLKSELGETLQRAYNLLARIEEDEAAKRIGLK